MRTDLYSLVHKAQRARLFRFGEALGRADLTQPAERAQIVDELRGILEMLRDHARNEEHYIHPLFARLGDSAAGIHNEHRELDAHMAEITATIATEEWSRLYARCMRLIGEYLLHIDAEERAQAEILWPHYADADLQAVFARFKTERAPADASADLELMLPALNMAELAGMFRGMKATLPPEAFESCAGMARRVLGEDRAAQLNAAL